MAVRAALTQARKAAADRLCRGLRFPFSGVEVTRASAWLCLLAAVARFQDRPGWTFGLLLAALVLDIFDGVVARKRGESSPETDWAADRFGELVFVGALLARDPLWIALPYTACYIANVFLPRGRFTVLPLRHALGLYLFVLLVRGPGPG
jgi:hypothetical protein